MWSTLARAGMKDRRLLRELGSSAAKRVVLDEEEPAVAAASDVE